MEILKVEHKDYAEIVNLVADITVVDIEPFFTEQDIAQQEPAFAQFMAQSIEITFDESQFVALKITQAGQIIGFGAIRDGNYLTHLFIAKQHQEVGLGQKLLNTLISSSTSSEIKLRSSLNAVGFYQDYGFSILGPEARHNGIPFVPLALVR